MRQEGKGTTKVKKAAVKKAAVKKAAVKKAAVKKAAVKKAAVKKAAVKKAAAPGEKISRGKAAFAKVIPEFKEIIPRKSKPRTEKPIVKEEGPMPEKTIEEIYRPDSAERMASVKKAPPRALWESGQGETGRPYTEESRVRAMAVHPYKLFVYWDINEEELDRIISDGKGYITVLRVHCFEKQYRLGFFDIRIMDMSGSKYIEVIPDRGYEIDIGIIKGEEYTVLTKSGLTHTPAFTVAQGEKTPEEVARLLFPGKRLSS